MSLWYDSTWDGTPVSWAIGELSNLTSKLLIINVYYNEINNLNGNYNDSIPKKRYIKTLRNKIKTKF